MPRCFAKSDDVPDHQEIAGQPQAADDRQLARQLAAHLGQERVAGVVAVADAAPGERFEVALLALAAADRIARERVAEIGERERAARRDLDASRAPPPADRGTAPPSRAAV